jgi:hypothetical protein
MQGKNLFIAVFLLDFFGETSNDAAFQLWE